jgi:FAD synthase
MSASVVSRVFKRLTPSVTLTGVVVRGFGRGSRLLGFPTANLSPAPPDSSLSDFLSHCECGIYIGYGKFETSAVHVAAVSVGFNPTFTDVKDKVLEVHLLHDFGPGAEHYGEKMRVQLKGWIRSEVKFTTLEQLKAEIRADSDFANEHLLKGLEKSARLSKL